MSEKFIEEKRKKEIFDYFLELFGVDEITHVPELTKNDLWSAIERGINDALSLYNMDSTIDLNQCLKDMTYKNIIYFRENKYPLIVIKSYYFNYDIDSLIKISLFEPDRITMDDYDVIENQKGFLHIIKQENIDELKNYTLEIIKDSLSFNPNFICFPELTAINDESIDEELLKITTKHNLFIIYGSYHDDEEEKNIAKIYCPDGRTLKQYKIFAAHQQEEGITNTHLIESIIIIKLNDITFTTLVCIDSERERIRDILKQQCYRGLGVDLIFNPSFTTCARAYSVLENLQTLLYCCIIFSNHPSKGGSSILLPLSELKDDGFKIFTLEERPYQQYDLSLDYIFALRDGRKELYPELIAQIE